MTRIQSLSIYFYQFLVLNFILFIQERVFHYIMKELKNLYHVIKSINLFANQLVFQKTFVYRFNHLLTLYNIFIHIYHFNSQTNLNMKNIQRKVKPIKTQEQIPLEEVSYENTEKQPELHFFNKQIKNDSLFVTFSGIIEGGVVQNCQQLTLFYTFAAGPDWKIVSGKQSGVSQIAGTDGNRIVWNLPFQIAYETTYLSGWPQLIVLLYGTDFFGRSFVQGYGNVHLPMGAGVQSRKIRVFKPLPQSIISGIFGYLGGTIAQYKDTKKVLSLGQGRQVTRVCTQGEISLKVQTTRHNFKKFGYE